MIPMIRFYANNINVCGDEKLWGQASGAQGNLTIVPVGNSL